MSFGRKDADCEVIEIMMQILPGSSNEAAVIAALPTFRKLARAATRLLPSPPDLIGWPSIPEPPRSITHAPEYWFARSSRAMTAMKRGLDLMRRRGCGIDRLAQDHDQRAEADIEQRQQQKRIAKTHHHRLAMHDLRQLLHRHHRGIAEAREFLGEHVERLDRGSVAPVDLVVQPRNVEIGAAVERGVEQGKAERAAKIAGQVEQP